MATRTPFLRAARRHLSSSTAPTPFVSILLGKPGGGKGTISKWLMRDFGFTHLSAGDLLRQEVNARDSQLGKEARQYMDKGELVPDQLISDIILSKLNTARTVEKHSRILLDGFPRTLNQAHLLHGQQANVEVSLVANLEVPSEEIITRLSDRWIHQRSGRVYSYSFNPPKEEGKDDETGEELIRRSDDEPDKIARRLTLYDVETFPLIEYYKNKGVLQSFSGKEYPELIKTDKRSQAIYKLLAGHLESQLPPGL